MIYRTSITKILIGVFILIGIIAIFQIFTPFSSANTPKPNITMDCTVDRVIDGDTLVVTIPLRLHVRLLDCWAEDGTENDKLAKELIQNTTKDKICRVSVNLDKNDLSSVLTFNRILGTIYVDDVCINKLLLDKKYATIKKKKK